MAGEGEHLIHSFLPFKTGLFDCFLLANPLEVVCSERKGSRECLQRVCEALLVLSFPCGHSGTLSLPLLLSRGQWEAGEGALLSLGHRAR